MQRDENPSAGAGGVPRRNPVDEAKRADDDRSPEKDVPEKWKDAPVTSDEGRKR